MIRKTLRRKALAVIVLLCFVYLLFSAAAGVFLMEGALHPGRSPVRSNPFLASLSSQSFQNVTIVAADGAPMRAWYLRPAQWNHSSVVLLHGAGDNRSGMAGFAEMLFRENYAVLLPDSRAQGESGGDLATYGLLESDDIHRWLVWMAESPQSEQDDVHGDASGCLYLFGESQGAALAIEATEGQKGVCGVVAEAPFSDFATIGNERISQQLRIAPNLTAVLAWPMERLAFLEARLRYGLDFDLASPKAALAQSRVPALLIAGTNDQNIPAHHSRDICNAASGECTLWVVPGAGHTNASIVDPKNFHDKVLAWLANHRGHPGN